MFSSKAETIRLRPSLGTRTSSHQGGAWRSFPRWKVFQQRTSSRADGIARGQVIIVTGGAGFIGSNLVYELNRSGERNILVVDNLAPAPNLSGPKFLNLAGAEFADYLDKKEFRAALKSSDFEKVTHPCDSAPRRLLQHARGRWPLHDGQQLYVLEGVFALCAGSERFLWCMPARQQCMGPGQALRSSLRTSVY